MDRSNHNHTEWNANDDATGTTDTATATAVRNAAHVDNNNNMVQPTTADNDNNNDDGDGIASPAPAAEEATPPDEATAENDTNNKQNEQTSEDRPTESIQQTDVDKAAHISSPSSPLHPKTNDNENGKNPIPIPPFIPLSQATTTAKTRLDMEAALDAAQLLKDNDEDDSAIPTPTELNRNQNIALRPGAYSVPGLPDNAQQQPPQQSSELGGDSIPQPPDEGSTALILESGLLSTNESDESTDQKKRGDDIIFAALPVSRTKALQLMGLGLVALVAVILCVSLLVTQRQDNNSQEHGGVQGGLTSSTHDDDDNSKPTTTPTRAPSFMPTVQPNSEAAFTPPKDKPSGDDNDGSSDVPSQFPSNPPSSLLSGDDEAFPPSLPYGGFPGDCFFCTGGGHVFWQGGASQDDFLSGGDNYPSYFPPGNISWEYRPDQSRSAMDAIQEEETNQSSTTTELPPILFGASPALTDDWMALGSQGSVFVYRRTHSGNGLAFHSRLYPNNGTPAASNNNASSADPPPPPAWDPDLFGLVLEMDGNRIVVGATAAQNHNNGPRAGAAHVFDYVAETDEWVEVAQLAAPDNLGRDGDQFGYALAMSDNTIVVGECTAIDPRVWVFDVLDQDNGSGVEWVHTQVLAPSSSSVGNYSGFGCKLAMDNTTLVIGAPTQLYPNPSEGIDVACGSVHVHEKTLEGTWNLTQVLAPDTCPWETMGFGASVAVEHGTMVVGAPLYGAGMDQAEGQGAFFVYQHNALSGLWERILWNFDTVRWGNHQLGSTVAISGNVIAVGSQWTAYTSSGRIELYTASPTSGLTLSSIYSPAPLGNGFGTVFALHDNTLLATDHFYETVFAFASNETTLPPPLPPTLPTSSADLPSLPLRSCAKEAYKSSLYNDEGPCGNCWQSSHERTGCSVEKCRCRVCYMDPSCCETAWDETCVQHSYSLCACVAYPIPKFVSSSSSGPSASPTIPTRRAVRVDPALMSKKKPVVEQRDHGMEMGQSPSRVRGARRWR